MQIGKWHFRARRDGQRAISYGEQRGTGAAHWRAVAQNLLRQSQR